MTEPKWERPPMAEDRMPLDCYIATITRREWRAAMRQARREARREALIEAANELERRWGLHRSGVFLREMAARKRKP